LIKPEAFDSYKIVYSRTDRSILTGIVRSSDDPSGRRSAESGAVVAGTFSIGYEKQKKPAV
jgi:hypothetical protein